MSESISQDTLWGDPPLKQCPQCTQSFPAIEEFFHHNKRSHDGLNRLCKECNKAHVSAYSQQKKIENKEKNPFHPGKEKRCSMCKTKKLTTEENFSRCVGAKDGLAPTCNLCNRAKSNQYRQDNLEKVRAADKARRPRKRPLSTLNEKYCSGCQIMKPRTEEFFHRQRSSDDGLTPRCKVCNNKKNAMHKAGKRALRPVKQKSIYCSHGHPLIEGNLRKGKRECLTCHREREARRSQSKSTGVRRVRQEGYCINGHPLVKDNLRTGKHAGACLTCHRESGKRRYHKDPEKMVAHATAYAKTHREQVRKRFKGYRKTEAWKSRQKASNMRRRARSLNNKASASLYRDKESITHLDSLRHDLCCYCGAPMQHIDHIVPLAKNGDEHWTNLTAACQRCNSRKHDKSLLDFMLYRLDYPDKKRTQ